MQYGKSENHYFGCLLLNFILTVVDLILFVNNPSILYVSLFTYLTKRNPQLNILCQNINGADNHRNWNVCRNAKIGVWKAFKKVLINTFMI